MNPQYDVIVVGASAAGTTVAAELAAAGRSVLLLDRAVFPREKPCGEGLMPAGSAAIEEWGLLPALLERGARPFEAIRFRCGTRALQVPFPRGARGLCVRRLTLDQLLLQRAASVPGVTLREGFRVRKVLRQGDVVTGVAGHPADRPSEEIQFHAPVTLACDGIRSLFHIACGLRRRLLSRRRWGIVGHLRVRLAPVVEIFFFEGGQVFVAPCGEEEATVALLLEEASLARFAGRGTDAYLETLESLGLFGVPLQATSPVEVVGPLGFTVDPVWQPGMLLVGDAAGFFDPITGEGMTAAILGARAAAAAVREAFDQNDFGGAPFQRYAEARSAMLRDITRLTAFLLRLARRPAAVERALGRFARRPALLEKLMGIAAGASRWKDIPLRDRLLLATGL